MKKSLIFAYLLICFACQGQSLLTKRVVLQRKEGTVAEFLDELNKQPGINIVFSSDVVNLDRKLQVKISDNTLGEHLQTILQGQRIKIIEQVDKILLAPDDRGKNKFTISGFITDKKSGERMIGASVFIPSLRAGTTSNTYGFFSITLEKDSVELQVSYAGYYTWSAKLFLENDMNLQVELEPNTMINELVIVNAEAKPRSQNRTLVGRTDISPNFIKSVSSLMSEPDLLKSLQLLPGIQSGNEGSAGLIVRGGSADQNLILLDGTPVYNATHAFGLFSIFNADAVNNVEVLKSGFPASYGGRLSSVIDVHMKEGDKYNYHGEGGLGLIFSKFSFEGPIKKGKSSFLISGRRTYADLILGPIQKWTNDGADIHVPFFSDLNLKANFPVGNKDRFYFSFYTGQDKHSVKDDYTDTEFSVSTLSKYNAGFSWGNITGMMRWNHVFSKKIFSNFTFTHSRYRFKTWEYSEETGRNQPSIFIESKKYSSGIRDWTVRADIDYLPAPDHFIKAGVSATWHRYQPAISYFFERDAVVRVDKRIENHSQKSGEYDAWIEDDIRLSEKMKTNIGVRYSLFTIRGKTFSIFQPRVNWLYKLDEKWSLKSSFSRMNQFIHLLSNNALGLPTDLWLPVTERVPPQTSWQVSAGTSYDHDNSLTFSMEVYYKKLKNVIEYTDASVFFNAYDNWEDMVVAGKGRTYGIEWFAQKKKGKWTGLASYTLSRSTRQFAEINEGKEYPFRYDRRHELKTAIVYKPSSRFEASANWFLMSGIVLSLPNAWYYDPYSGRYIYIYESRNNHRLPAYHRMDISFKFMKQKKKYLRTWIISVYNVYNRLNPLYLEAEGSGSVNKIRFTAVTIFPILPSVSYQFKF
jgi:outer membrane receptor for ferrienterochelin and colicin